MSFENGELDFSFSASDHKSGAEIIKNRRESILDNSDEEEEEEKTDPLEEDEREIEARHKADRLIQEKEKNKKISGGNESAEIIHRINSRIEENRKEEEKRQQKADMEKIRSARISIKSIINNKSKEKQPESRIKEKSVLDDIDPNIIEKLYEDKDDNYHDLGPERGRGIR